MLEKTRGIVLKLTNYGDTSVVATILTESFGVQSYMVQGARRPRAKLPVNRLQPLQLLDLVVHYRSNANLQRISESMMSPAFLSIPYDISKSSVVLFLNEVLYKVLRHQESDAPLFQFVFNAVAWLDSVESMPADFHLYFLVRLTRFLGFHPVSAQEGEKYFDLKNGVFAQSEPPHPHVLTEPYVAILNQLTRISLDQLHEIALKRDQRRYLLGKIIEYYRLHIDNFGEIKSHAVLEEVML